LSTLILIIVAVTLIGLVLSWSGRYGGRPKSDGVSLRRGPRAHTTSRGRAKVGYATREAAEHRARELSRRDGATMNVYHCDTCAKWHVGHG